ncbi:hypothetical protein [Paraburkholderia sp. JHI869]|uniref:bestrophin-like domain n=1 Tax=Paraburkholderia sp. JHI869 TaxID=3112959 RepID=UPI00317913A5
MIWMIDLVAQLPDFAIVATAAISTALVALAIAAIVRLMLKRSGREDLRGTVADVVHGSLLALIVFVLAHVLSDVRSNVDKAEDQTLREASFVSRLDRQLRTIGGANSDAAREALRRYVSSVTGDDWRALAAARPELSPRTGAALNQLIEATERVAAQVPVRAELLETSLREIEDMRQLRLESATHTVPRIFWWVIWAVIAGAMAMNGRFALTPVTMAIIALHMAVIGMVVALIVILDEPYRGQSAVSPAPLEKAVGLRVSTSGAQVWPQAAAIEGLGIFSMPS